jgi:hypothetical protein
MIVTFMDLQDSANPLNGVQILAPDKLIGALMMPVDRDPYFCNLQGSNDYKLLVGVGDTYGCVQFSSADGRPPYLVALADDNALDDEYVEFLAGDTPTPIAKRYCLAPEAMRAIAVHFLISGQRLPEANWEEI